MIIAGYRINLDALLARVVYRWHWKIALAVVAAGALIGIASGVIPPFWRGRANLQVRAAPEARITIDGRPWSGDVYAGEHTVAATLPDGRRSWVRLTLQPGETVALDLPPGLLLPKTHRVPSAAPGMRLTAIWRAGDSWRVQSVAPPPVETSAKDAGEDMPATHTIAIGTSGIERLTTIDAYRGRADVLTVDGTRYEAAYEPAQPGSRQESRIIVRGWEHMTVTVVGDVSLVRFAPDGQALLLAERTVAGEHVRYLTPDASPVAVVALPGEITGVAWHPSGNAVLIASRDGTRRALTLARLRPTPVAAVVAEPAADGLPPYAWSSNELVWITPDDAGRPQMWRASLDTLLPERQMPLEARAIMRLADGTLRVVLLRDGEVIIGRLDGERFIGETTIAGVPARADLAGEWYGNELLLRSGNDAWLITIVEGEGR
ncbi:MAG: hypothetical protein NZ699_01790 [Roseiflexus sp.]|nr:hypothetical protein [Roseiflexus sp.]MCS7287843.1 hypothetical protein [Roseiflexus sp.]MDW8147021.1 hypothetical protein [Roseiflexaceae bacterium]MDW8233473.1 hypothetical protein [Roseiflexaceae bacterium]